MKKFLRYSGIIALFLAIASFVLLLMTQVVIYTKNNGTWYSGLSAIFGKGKYSLIGFVTDVDVKAAWPAKIAWFLILASLIVLSLGLLLPLTKANVLIKLAGLLNFLTIFMLLTAGILILFFVAPTFLEENLVISPKEWKLGDGWLIAGALSLSAGLFAILPTVGDFYSKRR